MNATDHKKLAQIARRLEVLSKQDKALSREADKLAERIDRVDRIYLGAKQITPARERSLLKAYGRDKARLIKIESELIDLEQRQNDLKANAQKLKAKNPRGTWTAKDERQYQAIERSEMKRGAPKKTAQRIAAATVNKRRAGNPSIQDRLDSLERGLRALQNNRNESTVRVNYARKRLAEVRRTKDRHEIQDWTRAVKQDHGDLKKIDKEIARTKKQIAKLRKRNPSAKSTLKRAGKAAKGVAGKILGAASNLLAKGAKAISNPKTRRMRNPEGGYTSLVHKGRATRQGDGWKVGRKSFQGNIGTVGIGRNLLLDKRTGDIWGKVSRNPNYNVQAKPKYTSTISEDVQAFTRSGAIRKATAGKLKGPRSAYKIWVAKNPGKPKGKAASIRKKFAGSVSGSRNLYFPNGAPKGQLAKLGKLIKIKTRKLIINPSRKNPTSAEVWLCCDARGKLWLGCTKAGPLYDGPARDLGEINEIEYQEAKPHLGHPNQTIFFHKLGEVTGQKPHLVVNGENDLLIKGGAYKITRRGIVN